MRYEVMRSSNQKRVTPRNCPALAGLLVPGATRGEAVDNIRAAIAEYLDYLA